jgi:hypothetical protein
VEKGEIIWSKKSRDYPLKRFSCKKWNACLSYFSTDLEVLNVNQPNVFLRQARTKKGATPLLLKTFPRDDFSSKYEENFFLKICIKLYYRKVPAVLTVLNVCIGFINQGILKGEVSLYHWTPDWLVWNQPYDNWQFLFLFAKQTNPYQSNRRYIVTKYV